MISEKELDELAEGHHCLSPHEMDCFSQGFRASEKIYLAKIAELEALLEKIYRDEVVTDETDELLIEYFNKNTPDKV